VTLLAEQADEGGRVEFAQDDTGGTHVLARRRPTTTTDVEQRHRRQVHAVHLEFVSSTPFGRTAVPNDYSKSMDTQNTSTSYSSALRYTTSAGIKTPVTDVCTHTRQGRRQCDTEHVPCKPVPDGRHFEDDEVSDRRSSIPAAFLGQQCVEAVEEVFREAPRRSVVMLEPFCQLVDLSQDLGAERFGDFVPTVADRRVHRVGAFLRRHAVHVRCADELALLHEPQHIAWQH